MPLLGNGASAETERVRAAGYIRVSDLSQVEGHSLDAQERHIMDHCKTRGWVPVRIYREEGRSARHEAISKRPLFKELLEDVARGKYDVVLIDTMDRWSRNLKVTLDAIGMLGQHGVGLVSITENIDYSTPHGKLATQMIGGMAEFFSDMLAVHTRKGIEERARKGFHLGSIPFGYESCWKHEGGERILTCDIEHPGGIHIQETEGQAVKELFRRYATGTTTLSQLAVWMNDSGLRTKNRHRLQNGDESKARPRLFTTASVRGILHNPFFTGKVKHKDETYPGLHEPLVSDEVYDQAQSAMRKNSGRSATMNPRPQREYLLKGLIRCAHCLMPMWAQTYKSGRRYYREHKGSRGSGACVNRSGSILCGVPDRQMDQLMEAIVLPSSWMDRVQAKIGISDEVERVENERIRVERRLRRLGQVYLDNLVDYEEYSRQKRQLEDRLSSLRVPGVESAEVAGKMLESLPQLWAKADLSQRREMLTTMFEAVYVECKEEKSIVAIRAKSAFRPLFEIASTIEGSQVVLVVESELEDRESPAEADDSATIPCSWWRRGRVELPVQKTSQLGYATGLVGT